MSAQIPNNIKAPSLLEAVSQRNFTLKDIIVILLIIFVYPLGILLMFSVTKWKTLSKVMVLVFTIAVPIFPMIFLFYMIWGLGGYFPLPNNVLQKQEYPQRKADVSAIINAANLYLKDNGTYPNSLDELSPQYISKIPNDSVTNAPYNYLQSNDGKDCLITLVIDDLQVFSRHCVPN